MQTLRRQRNLIAILIATLLCYLRVGNHDWLNWDDPWLIVNNPYIQKINWANLIAVINDFSLSTRLKLGAEYLPLRDLSTMFNLALFGTSASAYLLTNVAIYLGAIAVVYLALRKFLKDELTAGFITLLFALHPVHVESVAWASSRKDVLALFFGMAAWLGFEQFLKRPQKRLAIWIAIAFGAALLSKYTAIVLFPWFLLRLWLVPGAAPSAIKKPKIRLLIGTMTIISVAHMAIVMQVGNLVGMQGQPISSSAWISAFTIIEIFRRYLSHLLLPFNLIPLYEVSAIDPFSWPFSWPAVPTWLLLISMVIIIIVLHRLKKKQVLFWIYGFIIGLLPVSQIVPLQNKLADRYLLFSSLAFCGLLVHGLRHPIFKAKKTRILIAISLIYFVLTYQQVGHWKNNLTLWQYAHRTEPTNQAVLFKLSDTYREIQRYPEEEALLERLLVLNPNHERALNNRGINRYRQGASAKELLPYYQDLLSRFPRNPKMLQNYGFLLLRDGKPEEAKKALQQAVRLKLDYCLAMHNLGEAHYALGEPEAAAREWQNAENCKARGINDFAENSFRD